MRVLVVPEVYRRGDLSSNGTVNDAVTWIAHWLEVDPTLHVYWLLPTRGTVPYDADDVLANRHRVTLIEADPPMTDTPFANRFTENGYSADQLTAIRERIFDQDAYLDVVVDQLRTGRFTLYKWLLYHVDQWTAEVRPFDIIANVHDLQVPFKYQGCSYRNAYQMYMELSGAMFADGRWFTAGVDANDFRDHASRTFKQEVIDAAMDESVVTGSPLAFDRFDESYRDEPETLHLAGSFAEKKRADVLFEVAGTLANRFGIETVLTSMDGVPETFQGVDWITAYPAASRAVYERMLKRGDLAVCASDYETMARTPFEQASSGQVLVLRDGPWLEDCVPDGYPYVGELEELVDIAVDAVDGWDRAVAANQQLVSHVREVRHPSRCGQRTYDDLHRRVAEKRARYVSREDDAGARGEPTDVVSRTLGAMGESAVAIDDVVEWSSRFTEDGRPLTDRPTYAFIDLVYTLRALGYEDTGEPGTPIFRPRLAAD